MRAPGARAKSQKSENILHSGEVLPLVDDAAISVAQAPRPNLVVTSITPPPNALPGAWVEVSWVVQNQGNAPAVGAWNETLYTSLDSQIGNDEQGPTFRYAGTLEPGQSVQRIERYQLSVHEQDYWIVICADTGGAAPIHEVIELDDTDNCSIVFVNLPQVDFQVQGLQADTTVVAGETLHVEWTVVNAGDGAAQGVWWDRLYLEPVAGGPAVPIGNEVRSEGLVPPGGTYSQQADAIVPMSLAGDYRPALRVDVFNWILEPGGEGNNYFVASDVTVTVTQPPLPDLRVQPFGPPPPPSG